MSAEIERKFLVARLPDLGGAQPATIRQGYLTERDDSVEVRVREIDGRPVLTAKSKGGLTRMERECTIDRAAFDALWPMTKGRRVEKRRWTGPLPGGLVYELDIFEGRLAPLMLVEVEFASEADAAAFAPPDWFGAEVTGDPAYANRTLAGT